MLKPTETIPIGRITDARDLGRLIRKLRKERGITLHEAAGLAGVGIRFLSELERGKSTAELGKALHVAHRIGVDLWAYARGSGPKASPG